MPYTFFGIGTQFIGKRDFGSDGSFVTTEFKTAMLPLYPLNTFRVIEVSTKHSQHRILSYLARESKHSTSGLRVRICRLAHGLLHIFGVHRPEMVD
jgi:hypothetical protein